MRNTRPESLQQELEMSLRRLNTDYIDIYIVHWREVAEYPCPISDTIELPMKAQGKTRAIGASNLFREQFLVYANNGELHPAPLKLRTAAAFRILMKRHGVRATLIP